MMCTVQLSCVSYFLLLKGQEEVDIQKEWASFPVKLYLLLEGSDTKAGCWKLFGLTRTDIVSSHSPVPLVNTQWKQVAASISGGELCLGWQRTRRQKCLQSKAVGNLSSFPSTSDNASLPAWPEGTGGWDSPQVISMRNLARSQLFPLPNFFYCLLSQPRMWALNCTTEL